MIYSVLPRTLSASILPIHPIFPFFMIFEAETKFQNEKNAQRCITHDFQKNLVNGLIYNFSCHLLSWTQAPRTIETPSQNSLNLTFLRPKSSAFSSFLGKQNLGFFEKNLAFSAKCILFSKKPSFFSSFSQKASRVFSIFHWKTRFISTGTSLGFKDQRDPQIRSLKPHNLCTKCSPFYAPSYALGNLFFQLFRKNENRGISAGNSALWTKNAFFEQFSTGVLLHDFEEFSAFCIRFLFIP